jgi:hypothetical protein
MIFVLLRVVGRIPASVNQRTDDTITRRKRRKIQTIIKRKHYTDNYRLNNTNLHKKNWVNSGAMEGYSVPAPLVLPVVLLLLKIR